jgi:FMN phosphatase YigB (HAD superfamily)
MAKSKHIVFDVDGVLLDWSTGFLRWVESTTDYRLDAESKCDTYEMSSWFVGMAKQDLYKLIEEFNGYPRALLPLDGSKSALLDFYCEGWEISILTAFGSCPEQSDFRQGYLKALFGDIFKEIRVLGLGACKEDALKDMKPDIFVEDNLEHAEKSIALGIKTYLISHAFNKGCEGAIYVDTLYEVEEEECRGII